MKFVKTYHWATGRYNVVIAGKTVAQMIRTAAGMDRMYWQFAIQNEAGEWDRQFVGHECAWKLRKDCEAAIVAHFAK